MDPNRTAIEDTLPAPAGRPEVLVPGSRLGRYVILSRLGAGGMGVVYEATDPELERKVAIKLLRTGDALASDAVARARLMVEARAMARLVHPHVITVHDVGVSDGQIFIAMELVDGGTLRGWRDEQRRPWREVLAMFLRAGRGLAAAHDAGIVHRDFKPDNVLLSRDGRVLVTDFGLARAERGDEPEASAARAPAAPGAPLEHTLTRTGALLGTPAYMSPEQLRGAPVDARSDQFSFCVALHEALYGERPFAVPAGDALSALDALALAVIHGRVRPPAPGSNVPPWLRERVLRGLAPAPDDRYPSMHALLAALASDPVARRRRVALGAVVVGLVALAVWGLVRGAPSVRCGGDEQQLAGAWDPALRARVEAAFAGTGRPYAHEVFARVARRLDQDATAWAGARRHACEATHVHGTQSEALLDLRMACLARRRSELAALVQVFAAGPDVAVLDRAVQAAAGLSDVDACAGAKQLERRVPPPRDAAQAGQVDELRARLDRASALFAAGKPRDAAPLLDPIVADAERIGYVPARQEALALRGRLRSNLDDASGAEADLLAALALRGESEDATQAAALLVDYSGVLVDEAGRFQEALTVARLARSTAARTGDELDLARADLAVARALIVLGRFAEAKAPAQAALAVYERRHGPDHPALVDALMRVAEQVQDLKSLKDAQAFAERALAIAERAYGPDHPRVSEVLSLLAYLTGRRGKITEARDHARRMLAIRTEIYGPDHLETAKAMARLAEFLDTLEERVAMWRRALVVFERDLPADHDLVIGVLFHLAGIETEAGRLEQAEALLRRVLAADLKNHGARSSAAAGTYKQLGQLAFARGHRAEAREHFDRALEGIAATHGKKSLEYGQALSELGDALHSCKEAVPLYEEAVSVMLEAKGPESLWLVQPLMPLGQCDLEAGRHALAVERLERSVQLMDRMGPGHAGVTRAWLARALWAQGDRRRAREQAAKAEDELAADAGSNDASELELLRSWRASHR